MSYTIFGNCIFNMSLSRCKIKSYLTDFPLLFCFLWVFFWGGVIRGKANIPFCVQNFFFLSYSAGKVSRPFSFSQQALYILLPQILTVQCFVLCFSVFM